MTTLENWRTKVFASHGVRLFSNVNLALTMNPRDALGRKAGSGP